MEDGLGTIVANGEQSERKRDFAALRCVGKERSVRVSSKGRVNAMRNSSPNMVKCPQIATPRRNAKKKTEDKGSCVHLTLERK